MQRFVRTVDLSEDYTYYVVVRAEGGTGLMREIWSVGVRIDVTAPRAGVVHVAPIQAESGSLTFSVANISDGDGSGVAAIEYAVGTSLYGTQIVPMTSTTLEAVKDGK